VFQYDMTDVRDHQNKAFSEQSFLEFLKSIGLSTEQMPFSFEGKNMWKGKLPTFRAVSWGGYYGSNRDWIIFIAYRANAPKHTIQHTWKWDENDQLIYDHQVHEWMN